MMWKIMFFSIILIYSSNDFSYNFLPLFELYFIACIMEINSANFSFEFEKVYVANPNMNMNIYNDTGLLDTGRLLLPNNSTTAKSDVVVSQSQ